MANKRMIAVEPMRYRTRMLQAGDAVTMTGPHSRLYALLGKAKLRPAQPQLDHDGNGLSGGSITATGGDIAALRQSYLTRFGKRPFNGWSADVLREKLAQA